MPLNVENSADRQSTVNAPSPEQLYFCILILSKILDLRAEKLR